MSVPDAGAKQRRWQLRRRNGGRGRAKTRILFATDLHAGEQTYRKFLNSAAIYEADVLVLGGDLTGKVLAPIVRSNGGFTASFVGNPVAVGESGLDELEASFRKMGSYPVVVDPDEYERIRSDAEYRDALTERVMLDQVRAWLELAAERLGASGRPLFVTGGNDDPMSIEPIVESATYARNAESRVVMIDNRHPMISTGYGNQTPWACPRDTTEEELGIRIESVVALLDDVAPAIFNLHVPPYASSLDIAPRLDTRVSPPRAIPGETVPVGSHAVREAIERHQPMLALHGHIHESRGVVKIGRTTCVNPGSEYGEGVLRAAIIDVAEGEVLTAQLVTG